MTRKQLPRAIKNGSLPRLAPDAGATGAPRVRPDAFEAEPVPSAFARPIANDEFPAASIDTAGQAARRRLAVGIVERHKAYAALSAISPLPIINIAGVTAMIVRMVRQLSALYEVPFERERTHSAVMGLLGGAAPAGFGAAAASTLSFIIPGTGFVGIMVTALTAGTITRGLGLVFIEHFESTAAPLGQTAAEPAKIA